MLGSVTVCVESKSYIFHECVACTPTVENDAQNKRAAFIVLNTTGILVRNISPTN